MTQISHFIREVVLADQRITGDGPESTDLGDGGGFTAMDADRGFISM